MSVSTLAAVQTYELLITGDLSTRPIEPPDLQAEVAAFHELSTLLAIDPEQALQRFTDLALTLCHADSAGVSLLSKDDSGEPIFRWAALAGALARYPDSLMPRDLSPSGLCLDQGTTVLVTQPGRLFTSLSNYDVPVTEALVVPLYDTGRAPLGTLWIVSHDEPRFHANHARIMEQLAVQLVLALKLMQNKAEHVRAVAAQEERARAWEQALASKDVVIQDVHHRVKNSIQATAALLKLQARASRSRETRRALDEAQGRLSVFANVHELLYRNSGHGQAVGMASLLGSLTDGLRQSLADRSDRIRLKMRADSVSLHPDRAIPLALVVNEAVTNAYKHAFPNGRSGEIAVSLEECGDGLLSVRV
jgi:two-component sensor histidine kinase